MLWHGNWDRAGRSVDSLLLRGTRDSRRCRKCADCRYDFPELVRFAIQQHIDLTVVGAGALSNAWYCRCFRKGRASGLWTESPRRTDGREQNLQENFARGECSTAAYTEFDNQDDAVEYLNRNREHPVVVKADGLAAGRGYCLR